MAKNPACEFINQSHFQCPSNSGIAMPVEMAHRGGLPFWAGESRIEGKLL